MLGFGVGGTFFQLPIGWLAHRSSYKIGQLVCGLLLVLGTLVIPSSQPLPRLATSIVFPLVGAIGDMNTLAVTEAGDRVGEHQVFIAMTAIAMFYTLGSVLMPIATGATVSYVSEHGLMISPGIAGVLFVPMLILRQAPTHK